MSKRVNLYDRLPEIYRIKDSEQQPPYQLKNYLAMIEEALGYVDENIESLYHDNFIDTCADWVVPYIGDLLGTSHLSGSSWTLRADVADTIVLRRRKGTLSAIERLAYDLTEWSVHCVELRENLLWNQNLNHQRPDLGGQPPYGSIFASIRSPVRGGTMTLRDLPLLSLVNTPFDPFSHIVDLKPQPTDGIGYNLPNLAVFLWRLKDYQVLISKPKSAATPIIKPISPATGNIAKSVVCMQIHPLGYDIKLFNNKKKIQSRSLSSLSDINELSQMDELPIQIPRALLNKYPVALLDKTSNELNKYYPSWENPDAYVSVEMYDDSKKPNQPDVISDTGLGLQLYFPKSGKFVDDILWKKEDVKIRGANLSHWNTCLNPPLQNREIAIDPLLGRIAIGVDDKDQEAEAESVMDKLLISYTYGAVEAIGSHPMIRQALPASWNDEPFTRWTVNYHDDPSGLGKTLQNILTNSQNFQTPVIIEIEDSMVHLLDIPAISQFDDKNSMEINNTLIIRAADGQRPIIKLKEPLKFHPSREIMKQHDDKKRSVDLSNLVVRLEGLYITRDEGFTGNELIVRVALNRLEIINCTLDPGYVHPEGQQHDKAAKTSIKLENTYGFKDPKKQEKFNQIPTISIQRTITGPLFIETLYYLSVSDSIIDAASSVQEDPANANFAVSGKSGTDAPTSWGPPTEVYGVTIFGRMRVQSINGRGGIWAHVLEVNNNQQGCLKFCYFSNDLSDNRLPQNFACVTGDSKHLEFENELFGEPDYGQIASTTDSQIREEGPNNDAMGSTGFLLESHKWKNIQIRFREFMPVGVRPLLISVPIMEF
jgi:hypothetical protein